MPGRYDYSDKYKLDVRPGGKIVVHMQGPKGSPWEKPYPMGGEFREISKFDRLVFTSAIGGGAVHENLNEATFVDKGGKTEMTQGVYDGQESSDGFGNSNWLAF